MNTLGFYQGLAFTNASGDAQVSYNIENVKTLSFTMGHIDDSGARNATVTIYLDNVKYDSLTLTPDMECTDYMLDVSDTDIVRFVISRGGYTSGYAFGNVSVLALSEKPVENVLGDCNNDGKFDVADVVMLQRWLLNDGTKLTNWQNADLCEDKVINVFDLVVMKYKLIYG